MDSQPVGGAVFLIDPPAIGEMGADFRDWQVTIPVGRLAFAETSNDLDWDRLDSESLRVLNKSLDFFSVGGSGHHTLLARDDQVLWRERETGREARFKLNQPIVLPHSILSSPSPETREPPTPKYTEGYRYFRLAQTSDDVFTAFSYMYLAFERLASERVPRGGREVDWLSRTIPELAQDLPDGLRSQLGGERALAQFISQVYDVRCRTFHAKDGTRALLPLSPVDYGVVEHAYGFLLLYVRELVRARVGLSQHERILTDREIGERHDWIGVVPSVRFLGESTSSVEVPLRHADKDTYATYFEGEVRDVPLACSRYEVHIQGKNAEGRFHATLEPV